jgi:hypothetical protein
VQSAMPVLPSIHVQKGVQKSWSARLDVVPVELGAIGCSTQTPMPGAAPDAVSLCGDLAAVLSPEPVIDEFVRLAPTLHPSADVCGVKRDRQGRFIVLGLTVCDERTDG